MNLVTVKLKDREPNETEQKYLDQLSRQLSSKIEKALCDASTFGVGVTSTDLSTQNMPDIQAIDPHNFVNLLACPDA